MQVFNAIPAEGISQDELNTKFGKDVMKFAFANGMKKKLFALDKATKLVVKKAENPVDEDVEVLKKLVNGEEIDKKVAQALSKREFIKKNNIIFYTVTKGEKYQPERKKLENEITADMIKSESWKTAQLKPYNWNSLGKDVESGTNF